MRIRNTRWQQSRNEIDDEAKHSFAVGVTHISAISHRLADIARHRKRIDRKTAEWLDAQLRVVAYILFQETLAPMTITRIDDPDPLESVLLRTSYEIFSDGTSVYPGKQNASVAKDAIGEPMPAEFYGAEIRQGASCLGGSLPPGYDGIVADPPHRRQQIAKAATEGLGGTGTNFNMIGRAPEGRTTAPDQDFASLRDRMRRYAQDSHGLHSIE